MKTAVLLLYPILFFGLNSQVHAETSQGPFSIPLKSISVSYDTEQTCDEYDNYAIPPSCVKQGNPWCSYLVKIPSPVAELGILKFHIASWSLSEHAFFGLGPDSLNGNCEAAFRNWIQPRINDSLTFFIKTSVGYPPYPIEHSLQISGYSWEDFVLIEPPQLSEWTPAPGFRECRSLGSARW